MKKIVTQVELDKKIREVKEFERLVNLRDALPHKNGFPWYRWAKDFYDSTNKANFLCAANQVSKSSTQIRKAIDWATDQTKWKKLWPNLLPNQKPNQFWYFYPTSEVWAIEYETKWEPDFLPRGPYKDHELFGWKAITDKGAVKQIDFNSGVTIYCKSYAQKIKDLQSGSVHAMFLDEEPPTDFMPEIQARIRATEGYVHAVFTATLGQEYWRRVMEPHNKDEEIYPSAHKRSVSLYDSQEYIDGTKSRWTNERIEQIIAECATQADVDRRVFGRFVKSEGLKYESFDIQRNMMAPEIIPKQWGIFAGVDPGSGGKGGHPAAMIFIAVRPDYKEGWIFRGIRMDGIPTANPDILKKFRELKQGLLVMSQVYDYKDKDFFLVAQSQGEPFSMANKARDEGAGLLNSLFKNGMLKIFRGDPELDKLVGEILSLGNNEDKRKAKDDLIDATRYCAMSIPWDFSHIVGDINTEKFKDEAPDLRTDEERQNEERLKARRGLALNVNQNFADDYDSEIEFWNDLSGAGND